MTEELSGLHRSERDRFVAGVCGGLAETWRVDSNLVRLAWAVGGLVFFLVPAIGLYLIAWIILPARPSAGISEEGRVEEPARAGNRRLGQLLGVLLILVGAYYLADQLSGGMVRLFLREFRRYLWPILLIALGGALLLHRTNRPEAREDKSGEDNTSGG